MPIDMLLTTPCTILRSTQGDPDVFGDEQPGTPTQEATVCHLELLPPQTLRGAEDETLAYATGNAILYLPGTVAQPSSDDSALVDDVVWQFMEDPEAEVHPRTGQRLHYETLVRRTS